MLKYFHESLNQRPPKITILVKVLSKEVITMINEQKELIQKEYLKPFFAFALNRTNNGNEAEELSQEIVYQVISALSRADEIDNFNAFVWSIAHNTYKRWLNSKHRQNVSMDEIEEFYGDIIPDANNFSEIIEDNETINMLRREICMLAKNYRQIIVCYYFDELSCEQISKKLNISLSMIKFYLFRGRQLIREGMNVMREYGEKSFKPSRLSIYWHGDWKKTNIAQLFKRKLPSNIVLAAYDKPITVSDLSLETGVPTVYLEDEINILVNVGLLQEVVKDKYQTNFFIAKKALTEQIKNQIESYILGYVDKLEDVFNTVLPEMKLLNIFKIAVPDYRYKWLFMQKQNIFNYPSIDFYPKILLEDSRGYVWGEEENRLQWASGKSPYSGEEYVLNAVDFSKLRSKHQVYLRNKGKLLYEIASRKIDENKTEQYAELIEYGYVLKQDGRLYVNIPVLTNEINDKLNSIIEKATREIREVVHIDTLIDTLERTIKNKFTKVIQGSPRDYAVLLLRVNMESALYEAMYMRGYINLTEESDNTPLTCYMELKN